MHHAEMLTGQCGHEDAAQRFAPATFWPHAGAQRMRLALWRDEAATLVTRTRPSVALQLPRQRTNGALMLEAVTVFVGPLATGVVAVEAWAPRSAGNDELGGTPSARAMRGAGMEDARHVYVLRRGCTTEDVVGPYLGRGSRPVPLSLCLAPCALPPVPAPCLCTLSLHPVPAPCSCPCAPCPVVLSAHTERSTADHGSKALANRP